MLKSNRVLFNRYNKRNGYNKKSESILSTRSSTGSYKYSSLMAEPTRQLLYALSEVVERKVKEALSAASKEEIPAPYSNYDKDTYYNSELDIRPIEGGIRVTTGYSSYLNLDFLISIIENEDSLSTLQNYYSVPRTFTLVISDGRKKSVEFDIMDFDKNDMNEIAKYIADNVVDEFKNAIEKSGLKKKQKAVNVDWLAYAIQFEYDHNRRKKGGRVVRRDRTNDDFAFLEIPAVGDLLIQDLGRDMQFTLYKHGYKKELMSFKMNKDELRYYAGSSEQAKPILDKILNR